MVTIELGAINCIGINHKIPGVCSEEEKEENSFVLLCYARPTALGPSAFHVLRFGNRLLILTVTIKYLGNLFLTPNFVIIVIREFLSHFRSTRSKNFVMGSQRCKLFEWGTCISFFNAILSVLSC